MATLTKDANSVAVAGGVSDLDGVTILPFKINHTTGRIMLSSVIAGGGNVASINADTTAAQLLVTGTAGTDFAIVDNGTGTHTFNIPDASATARGLVTTGTQTIAGVKTFSSTISGSINGNAATVTTNANLTGVITSVGNATSIASQTGTGSKFVVDTSPTLVTPTIGAATATSINKVAITAPATSATLTIADGKTLTANNSITIAGTDSTTMTFPSTNQTIAGLTATQQLDNKTLTKPVINARNQTAQTYTPSAAGTATLDLSLADQHYITMPAGNITIALTNDTNNQIFLVSITQDSGGSRTVTWFSGISWVGGTIPTLTTTASKKDYFGFIRTGTGAYSGFIIGQNV